MKKMKVLGHRDPEREAMPLKFHLKDGEVIDGVDLCQLVRALSRAIEKQQLSPSLVLLGARRHGLYSMKKVVTWLLLQK